jgi:LPPG:FO 2-phospho-L-lactate transferase
MTVPASNRYVALSGGVGGAKLVLGLSHHLAPDQLAVVTNTGDDFEHLGFSICPDLDTVLYTLADWNNKELGWGQAGESWQFLEALGRLGGEDWFRLGDRDLATHVVRTGLLNQGLSLSEVIGQLCRQMGIAHHVVPMTDDRVRTQVILKTGGTLSFQHYFVRDRCEPAVSGFEFEGIDDASPSRGFLDALNSDLTALLICPSNPFVSVDPILSLPGVVDRIRSLEVPVVVVSNIVGGEALKGPAAKMMDDLGMPRTATAVAEHYVRRYGDLVSGFVLDDRDAALESHIRALGLETVVAQSVMLTLQDRIELAGCVLGFAQTLTRS